MPLVQLNGDIITQQPGGDTASDHRKQTMEFSHAAGPVDWNSLRMTIASGMSLTVHQGAFWVRSPIDGTLYRISQDSVDTALSITAASTTNPRIDQIIARVYDDAVDSSGQYQATVETIDGTATSGATLENRNGAPDPHTALAGALAWAPLADVLIPANASTPSAIRNRRPAGQYMRIPPLAAGGATYDIDMVQFEPAPGLVMSNRQFLGSDVISKQAAALCWFGGRGAFTTVRWSYYADTNLATGKNYRIVIYDASGRYIADTGTVAWAGSANVQRPVLGLTLPYAGYVWEPGYYYVAFLNGSGFATTDSAYAPAVYAGNPGGGSGINVPPATPNIILGSQSGGTTIQLALNGAASTFVDLGVGSVSSAQVPVPIIALSK